MKPPPVAKPPVESEFSLRRVRRDVDEGGASIHELTLRFLTGPKGSNPKLGEYLARNAQTWVGPVEIDIENIETIAGPGKQYHEPEDKWESRVGRILGRFDDLELLPPLIAGVKDDMEGREERSHTLKLVDGAHRLEAIRRKGHKTAWIFVFFSDFESKSDFICEYNKGFYNHNYRALEVEVAAPLNSPAISKGPPKLHSHYRRGHAEKYDAARENQPHWHTEYDAVAQMLSSLRGARILDAPFGTGRFIPIYQRMDCEVFGADISPDMLAQAQLKADRLKMTDMQVIEGNIELCDLPEVDAAVCIRFLNLVPPEAAERVVRNLARAARRQLILHIGTIDEAAIPPEQRAQVLQALDQAQDVQRGNMNYAAQRRSSFMGWCESSGFHLAEAIETQATGVAYNRVEILRFVR
ncbi:class I SAM-dependent methyltransferase [Roseococcus sp.]|uniref:class I SAM-dependent methyltransferase n=1 Tax=Roseococcus sp. TaxID=2109646 RepID=UPI003BAB2BD9